MCGLTGSVEWAKGRGAKVKNLGQPEHHKQQKNFVKERKDLAGCYQDKLKGTGWMEERWLGGFCNNPQER